MDYMPMEDGSYDIVVNVKFKVGERAYLVDDAKAIHVVKVVGIRIASYETREGSPDSETITYTCKVVGSNQTRDTSGTRLFGNVDEAVDYVTAQ